MYQNIILTGATGKTGQSFLKLLEKYRYRGKIIILTRKYNINNLLKRYYLDITILHCDLNNVQKIINIHLFKGSLFLHIAGINYSKKVLRFCLLNKINWLISVHTSGKFSSYKPQSKYYLDTDNYLKKYRGMIGVTLLYPTMIYGSYNDGNIHKLVTFLKKLFFFIPIVGKGENLIQPVFYEDLSDAYFKIIINKRKTINKEYILAGKAPIKYIDAIQEILFLLKKKYFFIKIPFFLIIFFVNFLSLFTGRNSFYWMILRMQENKIFSINEAKNDFNYNPYNFYDGIKLAFNNYFKKH
jgi:nucleoside-diphosphate-sugar epimerase